MSYFDDVIEPRIIKGTYYTGKVRNKMTYEQRENSGTLFKNDKKGNDKAPDYKGDCLVNGQKLQIAAWIKEGKKGKFLSLSYSEPFVSNEAKAYQQSEDSLSPQRSGRIDPQAPSFDDDFEDSVPF